MATNNPSDPTKVGSWGSTQVGSGRSQPSSGFQGNATPFDVPPSKKKKKNWRGKDNTPSDPTKVGDWGSTQVGSRYGSEPAGDGQQNFQPYGRSMTPSDIIPNVDWNGATGAGSRLPSGYRPLPNPAQRSTKKPGLRGVKNRNQPGAATQGQSTPERTSAFDMYADYLTQLGFSKGTSRSVLNRLVGSGEPLTDWSVTKGIRETSEWQSKFGGVMNGREKNNLTFMTEGQIMASRDAYKQVFRMYGINEKFWGQDDLDNFLVNNVSVEEVGERVELADKVANNQDPATLKALKDYYGIGKKDVVGYFLNEKKGITALGQQAQAAMLGGEAKRAGFDGIGKQFSERLVDIGKTQEEVRSAYQNVAETKAGWKQLAAVSGETLTNKQLVKDELNLDKNDKVGRKKRTLASQERARFGGSNGGDKQMGKSTSGDY